MYSDERLFATIFIKEMQIVFLPRWVLRDEENSGDCWSVVYGGFV